MPFLLAALLAVSFSAPFDEASARLIGFTPEDVTIEVSVTLTEPAAIVLLRGEDVAGTEVEPVALIQREDGSWGAVVELPARRDIVLVFEHIPPAGGSVLSAGATMVELGIPASALNAVATPESVEESNSIAGLPWIIVAVLAALTAIGLLIVWSRLDREREIGGSGDSVAAGQSEATRQETTEV